MAVDVYILLVIEKIKKSHVCELKQVEKAFVCETNHLLCFLSIRYLSNNNLVKNLVSYFETIRQSTNLIYLTVARNKCGEQKRLQEFLGLSIIKDTLSNISIYLIAWETVQILIKTSLPQHIRNNLIMSESRSKQSQKNKK